MGKPGGFFKKLKAKQRRHSSHTQRGTRGASKEERRLKHNERVVFYAAQREAAQLAAVSSSSEDEASTDDEMDKHKEERNIRRLRAMMGVAPQQQQSGRGVPVCKRSRLEPAIDGVEDEDGDDSARNRDGGSDSEILEGGRKTARTLNGRLHETCEVGDGDAGSEDWETFLPEDDSDDEELVANPEALSDDELLMDAGAADDLDTDDLDTDDLDADDLDADASLMDEDDGGSDGAASNPLFDLVDDGEALHGEAADLIDPNELEEGSDDGDTADAEDAYVDDVAEDDDGFPIARSKDECRALEAEGAALLPQFQLGTSSLETLESSVITTKQDPWYCKYHLDTHGDVDTTPMQQVPVPAAAIEALKESDAPLVAHAALQEEVLNKKQCSPAFVMAADFATVRPENVAVAASSHARRYLLHDPFFVPMTSRRGTSSSASSSAAAAAACSTMPPYMHPSLWERWLVYRKECRRPIFTVEERGLFDLLQGYPDLLDCTRCWQKSESRREVYLLHLLNHWFKARAVVMAHDRILEAHTARVRRLRAPIKARKGSKRRSSSKTEAKENGGVSSDAFMDGEDLELRDRGFGKTRLIVMLPMRHAAYLYVTTIVRILGANPEACPKFHTFEQDFTEVEEAMDPTFKRRPRDYRRQFDGNIDDSFCVGLRLEPHRVHVYAHPLNSDIIICSPLGLRRRLEKSGDVMVSLSSVEVCLVDEAHVLMEQNWQHVTAVMDLLNKRPTETTHGLSDLRRVYAWALEGKSGRHRQTILSTNISSATILGTFRGTVSNSGRVMLQHRSEEGVLSHVLVPVRQHFLRFNTESLETVDEDRFHFFTSQVYASKVHPLVERDVRTIIFVPSYYDFVRLRNYMHREYRESFAAISEYTSIKQQRRALGQFTDLERPVLLVTERFYFFKRYFVKMAEMLVFYSPPSFPDFYCALVNRLVATSPNALAMTVFGKYDTHEVNRIVGSKRMAQMLTRDSDVFSFVTA